LSHHFTEIDFDSIAEILKCIDIIIIAASINNLNEQSIVLSKMAKNYGVPIFAFLDSWLNFPERIQSVTFNGLLVADKYAFNYAKESCSYLISEICLITDTELEIMKNQLMHVKSDHSILLLETREDNFSIQPDHLHGPECFCEYLNKIQYLFPNRKIIYRRHPGIGINECHQSIETMISVTISDKVHLIDDFNQSSLVIGKPSRSLYLASELGLETFALCRSNDRWHGPNFNVLNL
jgi:hypothetical protein